MTAFFSVKCPFCEPAAGTQKEKKSRFEMKKKQYMVVETSLEAQDEFSRSIIREQKTAIRTAAGCRSAKRRMARSTLVRYGLSMREIGDILERGVEDAPERLFAVERDMGREDDIVATEEVSVLLPLPFSRRGAIVMVPDTLSLFFDELFPFEHIESGARKPFRIERMKESGSIYHAAAGSVDEERSRLDFPEGIIIDEMPGGIVIWDMERHDIRL